MRLPLCPRKQTSLARHGALLKNEQDVHLFERLGLPQPAGSVRGQQAPHAKGEASVGTPIIEVAVTSCSGPFFGGQIPFATASVRIAARASRLA